MWLLRSRRSALGSALALGCFASSLFAGDEPPSAPAKAAPAKAATIQAAPKIKLLNLNNLNRAVKAVKKVEAETAEKPDAAAPQAEPSSSHAVGSEIKVRGTDGKTGLQTICVDQAGRVLGLVAPPRGYDAKTAAGFGEVHVFDAEGSPVTQWKVNFHAQSINTGPDGSVYVAGDGRVARFDRDGKQLKEVALPHIEEILKDTTGLREQAEAQVKTQRDSHERIVKTYKVQLEKLEAKSADTLTKTEQTQLEQFRTILQNQEQQAEYYRSLNAESVMKDTIRRVRIINAIAIGEQDVFIVCGESKGYGFSVWRTDLAFQKPKQVMSGLRGCCGQMDLQVQGPQILVAENTQHRFGRYDREGKEIGHWGSRGKETDPGCFGGCCNPMNVRASHQGDIFTAESEGIVKRFSATGDYLGLVGKSTLTGGCKNVALGVSPDAKRVYFCDLPGSRIVVLTQKPTATAQVD